MRWIPRYLKLQTASKDKGTVFAEPGNVVWPVLVSCLIILDFFTEIRSLWELKKFCAIIMSLSRASLDCPRITRSSAKKIALMFMESRLIPNPEEFSKGPRSLMNKEKRSGLRLHPAKRNLKSFINFRAYLASHPWSTIVPLYICH